MATVYAVIMAGGRGERFWPLSSDERTKPFIPLLSTRTMIQDTVERLSPVVPAERVLVSIGEAHREIARQQLPQIPLENLIVEPIGRDTAACLGLCALHLERRDPQAIMLAVPADHFIDDPAAYRRTIQRGIDSLGDATAVVFGIKPSRAETGYGYIQAQTPKSPGDPWPVTGFVEKPDVATAMRYLRSGNHFWNSGLFLWRNRTLMELFQRHLPETYRGLCEMRPLLDRPDSRADQLRIFLSLPRISIDFGIMEKTSGLLLIPVEFGWDDIGYWAALERALPADANGNVSRGHGASLDSEGCIVYSDAGTVATFGVSNLVIVQANGKVLVCAKDRSPDLKRMVTSLAPEKL